MTLDPNRWQHLEPFIYKLSKQRIQLYDEIMEMSDDIEVIANTYSFPIESVKRAKDYAFGNGVSQYQFYPDSDMAEAWLRLAHGNGTAIDRIFLEHEIYESGLVLNQGIPQTDAHNLTQLKFPWSILLKEGQL
jgi:isocitrate dehydrogenase kinase/phosphatase